MRLSRPEHQQPQRPAPIEAWRLGGRGTGDAVVDHARPRLLGQSEGLARGVRVEDDVRPAPGDYPAQQRQRRALRDLVDVDDRFAGVETAGQD